MAAEKFDIRHGKRAVRALVVSTHFHCSHALPGSGTLLLSFSLRSIPTVSVRLTLAVIRSPGRKVSGKSFARGGLRFQYALEQLQQCRSVDSSTVSESDLHV